MSGNERLLSNHEGLLAEFARSRYAASIGASSSIELCGTKKELRRQLRSKSPQQAGVYGMVDELGHVIYVGMSKQLSKRLPTYFSSKVRRKKETSIGRKARLLFWQPVAHELIARLRERELIRRFRPSFNVQGHPSQMKLGYITVVDTTAGGLALQKTIPRKHLGVWGPIPLTRHTRAAVEALNHHFRLRDCPRETPMQFKEDIQTAHLPTTTCLRAELGTCLAPCIGGCSRRQYSGALAQARAFLDGRSNTAPLALETSMRTAASEQKFELAARLRDRLESFQRLDRHLRRFHDWTSNANFVYRATSEFDGHPIWMVVVRGNIVVATSAPRTPNEKLEMRQRIEKYRQQISGKSNVAPVISPDDFEASRILFRWFRLFETEKQQRISLAKAFQLCQSKRKRA